MTAAAPRRSFLRRASRFLYRDVLRTRLAAAAEGQPAELDLQRGEDILIVLLEMRQRLKPWTPAWRRLVEALERSGTTAAILDGLAANRTSTLVHSCRLAGALGLEPAVPWLAQMLGSPQSSVRLSAARALGRIGGLQSAEALLAALRARRGSSSRLSLELARSAPDLFLERALREPEYTGLRASIAVAAGLRRRRTAVPVLLELLESGSARERQVSCRALGWIRDRSAESAIQHALDDPAWRVRAAAVKALEDLGAHWSGAAIEQRAFDRNSFVRRASAQALRRRTSAVREAS